MAAVAAKTIGNLASEASERFGKVRSDNKETFDKLGDRCGGAQSICVMIWATIIGVTTSAFFPYLLVTFVLNVPPFAYGLASVFSEECSSSWLFFNAFLTVMHMGISVYGVLRIREESKKSAAKTTENDTPYVNVDANGSTSLTRGSSPTGEPNSWDRIRVVMCYDMVMAIYYILFVVWVIWLGIGAHQILEGEVNADCGRWVVLSVIFGFLYMGLGVVAWVASLCFVRYNCLSKEQSSSDDVLVVDDNGGVALA